MLTTERVRHLFDCDADTGILVRKISRGKAAAGSVSEVKDRDGYLVIGIDNKNYRTHRVVWLYHKGSFPNGILDHINRIKTDNRLCNLREVSFAQSRENINVSKSNKCGVKGVWIHKYSGKWCASIYSKGKNIHIGSFNSIEDAKKAYNKAAAIYHTTNPEALRETT